MRLIIALPLLLVTACSVDGDGRNDSVTVNLNTEGLENTATELGDAAEQAASDVGNAARGAGDAIQNEVGDFNVDVDINRNRTGNAT